MNLLDFYEKQTLDITKSEDIGKIKYFLFNNRLRKLIYLVTDTDKYVYFKKAICGNAAVTTTYTDNAVDKNMFVLVKIGMPLATIDGKYLSKLKNITVDSCGNLLALSSEDRLFGYKDVFGASENLISLQGEKYKKPQTILKPKTDRPVNLISPTLTKELDLTEPQNYMINSTFGLSQPIVNQKMPSTIVCKFSFVVDKKFNVNNK